MDLDIELGVDVGIDPLPGPVREAATLPRKEEHRMASRKRPAKRATKKPAARKGYK